MAFLTSADYDIQIRNSQLQTIIDSDATLLTNGEAEALAEMRSYLNARYDTDTVFNASGDDRNKIVVLYMVDMVLYHVYSRLNPRNVPQLRKDRYNEAKQWLRDVCDCLINPDLPVPDDETKSYVLTASAPKRTNRF